jgi:hypothetical protein
MQMMVITTRHPVRGGKQVFIIETHRYFSALQIQRDEDTKLSDG